MNRKEFLATLGGAILAPLGSKKEKNTVPEKTPVQIYTESQVNQTCGAFCGVDSYTSDGSGSWKINERYPETGYLYGNNNQIIGSWGNIKDYKDHYIYDSNGKSIGIRGTVTEL